MIVITFAGTALVMAGTFVCDVSFFFFNATSSTEIYTLSLHDALPILMREWTCAARSSPVLSLPWLLPPLPQRPPVDRKSTRLNSSHSQISYAVFCLKKKKRPSPFTLPLGPPCHSAISARLHFELAPGQ